MKELLRQLLKELDRLWFFVSIGITVVFIILYFFVVERFADLSIRNFLQSVITNLIPIFLTIAVSYPLLNGIKKIKIEKETQDLIEKLIPEINRTIRNPSLSTYNPRKVDFYPDFSSVPWKELLTDIHLLDISIDYLDSWINENILKIKELFDNNGYLRLVLSDPQKKDLLVTIQKRIPEIEKKESIEEKIIGTKTRLHKAFEESKGRKARFEQYFVDEIIWYAGVRIDNKTLILAFFDQSRLMRASAPTIVIDLEADEITRKWFDREFNRLISTGKNQTNNPVS